LRTKEIIVALTSFNSLPLLKKGLNSIYNIIVHHRPCLFKKYILKPMVLSYSFLTYNWILGGQIIRRGILVIFGGGYSLGILAMSGWANKKSIEAKASYNSQNR
jgi:hypothetical protein